MKYMMMMHGNAQAFAQMAAWSPQDIKAMIDFMGAVGEDLAASGELVDARGLATPEQVKVVHAGPDGEAVVTDGPFPEAKEVLAGYWIIEVASEARAIELAARISACPGAGGAPVNQPIQLLPVLDAPEVVAD
jgi:hypothetical protein